MRSRLLVYIVALTCLLVAGCGSPEERSAAYLTKAQSLYDAEDYTAARIEAMNAAQIQPRNADVRYLLAEIEEKNQDFRKAIGHLQVAVDADETHLPSRIKLGNYYVLAKAADEADAQATAAESIAPDDPDVLLLRARVYYLRDDIDNDIDNELAMAEIEKVLAKHPDMIDATMFKAGIYIARSEPDAALDLVDDRLLVASGDNRKKLQQFRVIMLRAVNRNDEVEADLTAMLEEYPDDQVIAVTLAQLYASQGRIDESEKILRRIVDSDPTNAERRVEFVRFLANQRGLEAAEAALKEFIAETPDEMKLQLALGRLHESSENFDEAYSAYEAIEQANPTSEIGLEARNRMVAIKIRQGETDEARQMIADILQTEPNNAEALLVKAAFSFTDRDYDAAVTDLRTVLRSEPDSERARLLLARSHTGSGDAQLAQDAYRRLIEMNPNHPSASSELADLLARRGNLEEAEEVLRAKLEVTPDDRRAASNLVEALLLQGNTDDAEIEARTLMERDDPTGLAEYQLGRVLQAKNSNREAIAAYQLALTKNPEATQALQGLVAALIEDGEIGEAIGYLEKHGADYPEQIAPKLLLGAVLALDGNRAAAEEQFEAVIALQPNANRAYASLAALYPDNAMARIGIYERGVAANPTDETLGLLLASEYERAQEMDKAIEIYQVLMKVNESNDLVANNLAALLLDFRDDAASFNTALEVAKRFEDSKQPAMLDTLGWAYYRTGDYLNAIRYLGDATAGASNVALLHYHLGMAYMRSNNTVLARTELERAVELAKSDFPGIDEARATLEEIGRTAQAN